MLHNLETSWWFGCMPKDIEAFCKLTVYGVQVIASLNLLLYTPDNVIGPGTFALKEQLRDSLGFWSFFILKSLQIWKLLYSGNVFIHCKS